MVQVIRRLLQFAGLVFLPRLDDLVGHMTPGCDHDYQEFAAVKRHEIQPLERRHIRGNRESHLMRGAGDLLRHVREERLDRPGAPEPRLYQRSWPRSLAVGEKLIDVKAIPQVRRDPARRGVRLPHVAQIFEPRHDVPEGRRRDPESPIGEPQRRDWLTLVNVGMDQDRQDPSIPFR